MEVGARVVESLGDGSDLDVEIARRRDRLAEVMAPHDAVELLGQLGLSMWFIDPDTYSESEHPGLAYVVEMVVAQLLRREGRSGTEGVTAIDANVLEPVRELTAEATLLESLRRQVNAGFWSGPEGAARGRAAAHHLYMRSPGWWWQEHDVLRGLFDEERFATKLRAALGFDAEAAIRISEAAPHLVRDRVVAHMDAARDGSNDFAPGHPAYDWADRLFDGSWKKDPVNAARFMPGVWAMMTVGEASQFTVADLASKSGVDEAVVAAYLEQMSVAFGQPDEDWFALAETVKARPYVRVAADTYLLTVPGADLWSVRPAFETILKSDSGYLSHRAGWLERRTAQTLRPALAADETHLSVRFHEGDCQGEIDVLMRCGATAVIVEAKSAALRPSARRGGGALLDHLRKNLTKATEQGAAARRALVDRLPLFDPRGDSVQLAEKIRETHTVMVTLDDLSAVATVVWELQGTRTMPEGFRAPWMVTLNELEHVAATTRWPVQLIHFLRRRARLNELGRFVAGDELDWWMHHMMYGLYFEEEQGKERVRFTSLTDPLDAWVLFDKGIRSDPAPKPELQVPSRSAEFLDCLCSERPPGWVSAGCALLDASTDSQLEFWDAIDRLREDARSRGKVQRVALEFIEPTPLLFCAVVAPDEARPTLLASLQAKVMESLDQFGAQRVLALGSVVSSGRAFDALTVIDGPSTSAPNCLKTCSRAST
jgi:hypothetical protein